MNYYLKWMMAMKVKNRKTIDNFNPIVLKNMILFSVRSKNIYSIDNDIFTYDNDQTIYEFIVDLYLKELKKIIMSKPSKSYNELNEDLYFIKGKINVQRSKAIFNNKLNCSFGELSLNNKLNQIAKYVLFYLIKDNELLNNKNLRKRLLNTYYYFEEVDLIEISVSDVLNERLNRDNSNYETLLLLSKYLIGSIKYDDLTNQKYIDTNADLWWVFQEFIRNYYDYYKKRLNIRRVSPSKYVWDLVPLFDSKIEYLPGMRTDIEIDIGNQHIIIDAKCYENSLVDFYDKKIFHASNIYQIKSYLDVYQVNADEKILRGILIYPFNKESQLNAGNQSFYDEKRKYTIEIKTIDFNQDWSGVCSELDSILDFSDTYDYIIKTFE